MAKFKAGIILSGAVFSLLVGLPHAMGQTAQNPDETIQACLTSGTGVPTQLHHDICIEAANAAWQEASKTDIYSTTQQQTYWMQAFESADIAMLTRVKIDEFMSDRACQIAKFGLQCFNQVDPEGPMKSVYRKPELMQNFFQNCEINGFFDE